MQARWAISITCKRKAFDCSAQGQNFCWWSTTRTAPAWQLPWSPGHCRLVQGPENFNKLVLLQRGEVINIFAAYLIEKLCKPKERVTCCMALPRPPYPSSPLSPFMLLHCWVPGQNPYCLMCQCHAGGYPWDGLYFLLHSISSSTRSGNTKLEKYQEKIPWKLPWDCCCSPFRGMKPLNFTGSIEKSMSLQEFAISWEWQGTLYYVG